ncbi:hypothetical protein [Silanimonas sp.]|jgi:hypothetical protein|uniref:hypothetical protein n=1 Tax=Silanimonas sp. TaxID=1929290 RepID=UPI0022BCB479|nr:hypothetical protein [Silanimonas sp.]MCZ8113825.1 hypothetical protein [Silanimonas sp.]
MSDEPETEKAEGEDEPLAVDFPDPIYLTAPDGVEYVINCEATLAALLKIDQVPAYRVTDKGLEFLTEKRRWESVELHTAPARVLSTRKN